MMEVLVYQASHGKDDSKLCNQQEIYWQFLEVEKLSDFIQPAKKQTKTDFWSIRTLIA